MNAILVKIFATALALSEVTTQPGAVKTQFDSLRDQEEVVQVLRAGCAHIRKAFDIEDVNIDELIATAMDDPQALSGGVKALHGLSRALVNNMVRGVSEGFTKNLEIEGVGFKAAVQGQTLNLSLGFSHPVLFPIPKEIKITVAESTKITIQGIDKKLVGQVAADIRRYYPPEPDKETN